MKSVYFHLRADNIPEHPAQAHIKRTWALLFAEDPSVANDFEEMFLKKVEDGEIEIKEHGKEAEVDSTDRPKLGL